MRNYSGHFRFIGPCLVILVSFFLTLSSQEAPQTFTGYLVVEDAGSYKMVKEENIHFQLANGEIKELRIHLRAASKDLTFARCYDLKKDGSNFTDWFEKECRQLTSFDGTPVTYEPFLLGAYAGLSPPVLPGYSMYSKLKEVAEQLGLAVPERTFVIYGNDRSPTFEFFCYSENGLTKPAELQTELQRP